MPTIAQLQVGCRYAARDPKAPTVRITEMTRSSVDGGPYRNRYFGDDGCVYTEDGHFANHGVESAFDLIAEVPLTRWDRLRDALAVPYPEDHGSEVRIFFSAVPCAILRALVILFIVALAIAVFPFILLPYLGGPVRAAFTSVVDPMIDFALG